MIAEIKQSGEKNTPLSPPDVKVRSPKFTTVPMQLYSTLFLLFIVVATILFSVRSNQLFLKELAAPVFILGYALVMQIIEQRAKRTANSH
jgi:prolipoprotein diacylglyceryltransferase